MNICKQCQSGCRRVFCSTKCANAYNGASRVQIAKDRGERICDQCHEFRPGSAFSLVVKYHPEQGYRTTCKRCSAAIRETARRNASWKEHAARTLLSLSKQRAKRAGMVHTLTLSDIQIPDVCPVLGIPLKREDRATWFSAPSIDRIDSAKGYTPDNITIVSRRANILKRDATVEELRLLYEYYSQSMGASR